MAITLEVRGVKDLQRKMTRELQRAASQAVLRGLQQGAIMIEVSAKRRCAVDTGRLRASITHQPMVLGPHQVGFKVGTNVGYAPFVEFGTGRRGAAGQRTASAQIAMQQEGYQHGPSAGMPAQPFLFPALEENKAAVQARVADALEKALENVT